MRTREELPGRSPIPKLLRATLNFGVLWRPASGKKVTTCWYDYPINPIKLWVGVSHAHPLKDRRPRQSIPSQERPLLATSRTSSASSPCVTSVRPMPTVPVPRPCVQCQRRIPDARALTRHAPVLMPPHLRPYVPVKPRESALIPFCNVPPPRRRARLHLAAF